MNSIGFIGLGKMGAPMSLRLAQSGNQVVAFDQSESALSTASASHSGISARTLAGDVFRDCPTVILMLPDSDAVEAVLTDSDVVTNLAEGRLLIDMGSSSPGRTRELSDRLASEGSVLIDAPVSGGVRGAREGSLTIMVGGTQKQFEMCRTLLAPLGEAMHHAGGVGCGHAAKALNNLLSATHLLASSEALLVAERFGLDPDRFLAIVNSSSGRSASTEVKLPQYVLSRTFDSGFSLALMRKDVGTAADLSSQVLDRAPLTAAVAELFDRAEPESGQDADSTELALWLEQINASRPA